MQKPLKKETNISETHVRQFKIEGRNRILKTHKSANYRSKQLERKVTKNNKSHSYSEQLLAYISDRKLKGNVKLQNQEILYF